MGECYISKNSTVSSGKLQVGVLKLKNTDAGLPFGLINLVVVSNTGIQSSYPHALHPLCVYINV